MRLAMFVDGWNIVLVSCGRGHPAVRLVQLWLARSTTDRALRRGRQGKVFTSKDQPHPEKIGNQQAIWSRALKLTGCEIIEGEFRSTRVEVEEQIRNDGKKWREKQTDIALASHMIADCNQIEIDHDNPGEYRWKPGYDEAILLTQDSDFVPAVKIVASKPFNRRVHVLLPPAGFSAQENAARIWKPLSGPNVIVRQLSTEDFARTLLPKVVEGPHGEKVICYHKWMWREKYESLQAIRGDRDKPQVPKYPAPRHAND